MANGHHFKNRKGKRGGSGRLRLMETRAQRMDEEKTPIHKVFDGVPVQVVCGNREVMLHENLNT